MDTLDISVEDTITEEQLELLKRMQRNIKRSKGKYALYFVECNLPNLSKQLINKLDSSDSTNFLNLDIAAYPKDLGIHIDEWVSEKKKQYQKKNHKKLLDGINIIGLERLLPTDSDVQIIRTVSELNWRRGYFQALAVPIIFWLPSYALKLLTENANDFYDWYSDIYHFDSNAYQKDFAITQQVTSLRHPKSKIAAHQYQSQQEKEHQLRQLQALLDETNNIYDVANIKNQMALLLLSIGFLDKALLYFQEAYNIQKDTDHNLGQAEILSNISQVFVAKGDYSAALDILETSLNTINEKTDKTALDVTLNNIGLIYDHLGDTEKALSYYKNSLEACEKSNDMVGMGAILNNIASLYYDRGDINTASTYFQKALAICKEIDDKLGVANTLLNIGSIYLNQQDYDNANSYLKEALSIFREIGHKIGTGKTLSGIANIYASQGDLATALTYLEESASYYETVGSKLNLAEVFSKIAQIYSDQGKYRKAAKYLEESVDIYKNTNEKKALAYSSYNLGSILQKINSSLLLDENKHLQTAYTIAKELQLKDILAEFDKR